MKNLVRRVQRPNRSFPTKILKNIKSLTNVSFLLLGFILSSVWFVSRVVTLLNSSFLKFKSKWNEPNLLVDNEITSACGVLGAFRDALVVCMYIFI